jgi:hypothetical protein
LRLHFNISLHFNSGATLNSPSKTRSDSSISTPKEATLGTRSELEYSGTKQRAEKIRNGVLKAGRPSSECRRRLGRQSRCASESSVYCLLVVYGAIVSEHNIRRAPSALLD